MFNNIMHFSSCAFIFIKLIYFSRLNYCKGESCSATVGVRAVFCSLGVSWVGARVRPWWWFGLRPSACGGYHLWLNNVRLKLRMWYC